jgi:DNA-binding NtrC family response regulator
MRTMRKLRPHSLCKGPKAPRLGYQWVRSVRALKNRVHHAYILADDEIGVDCVLPEIGGSETVSGGSLHLKFGISLAEADRRLILATLSECEGDKRKAADALGISLKTLYNRLKAYEIQ